MGQTVCWWRGDCLLMEQRCSRSRLPARFAERCLPVADGSRSAVSVLNSKDSLEWGLRVSWINCRVTKFRPSVQGWGHVQPPEKVPDPGVEVPQSTFLKDAAVATTTLVKWKNSMLWPANLRLLDGLRTVKMSKWRTICRMERASILIF